ncbi:MAG: VanZ family protein [Clostridia bacterium]|jgi:hypothetical protein
MALKSLLKNKRAVISWSAMILWMLLIFILSAQSADDSSSTSGNILTMILKMIYPGFKDMDAGSQFIILEQYQGLIRKSAHFCIYGMLGIISFAAYDALYEIKAKAALPFAFITCVLYAVSDEIHQLFVPGRSCEFLDVIIDSAGALLGIIAIYLIIKSVRSKKGSIRGNP